jgi:uncharacterized membrane protein YkvI
MSDQVRIRKVIAFGGAFISFLIGSGFATGQELMQYFVAYGWNFILVALLMFVLFLYAGISFTLVGFDQQYEKPGDIYDYYCGPYVGRFYKYFSSIFVYMSFWVMIGGAGATLHQQFGLPVAVGGVVMGIIAITVVLFGLNRIVDVIGALGPIIVLLAIFLGISGIVLNPGGILKAPEILSQLSLLKAADNWFLSALSYVGFCMLWLAAFMAGMGKTSGAGGMIDGAEVTVSVCVTGWESFSGCAGVKGCRVSGAIVWVRFKSDPPGWPEKLPPDGAIYADSMRLSGDVAGWV